ncbi:MAG TPA: MOSC domain-containing protein [Thermoplasmata archaeon]|nr:MOSC domain-containing protein [Thermoplasmata archaeon]
MPKPSVEEIEIGPNGVVGDFNRYRHERLADEPTSAILLMPLETLQQLESEGWPVRSGDLGENVTTTGLGYESMRPGAELELGSVALTVVRPCDPCTNLYLLPYVGNERGPEFLRVMNHRRGWYARVVRPGRVRRGDPIVLRRPEEPPHP